MGVKCGLGIGNNSGSLWGVNIKWHPLSTHKNNTMGQITLGKKSHYPPGNHHASHL